MHKVSQIDVAVLTVNADELRAVQQVLKIDPRKRVYHDGAIYYETTRFSRLQDRDLKVVVHCIGKDSQASASAATNQLLGIYDPAILILCGIAAGWRNKLRIGDVAVAREIADLSTKVLEGAKRKFRPNIIPLPHPVRQMFHGFHLDEKAFAAQFRDLFGPPITPPVGQEEEYRVHVASVPRIEHCTVAADDNLVRDEIAFNEMAAVHQGIRVVEMESGGFVKACQDHAFPRPWLVIRGVSDFGDRFKNDDFHRMASCAAATYLDSFLADGCDIENLRPGARPTCPSTTSADNLTLQSGEEKMQLLSPLASEFLNVQFERFATALSEAHNRDIESIREAWRTSGRLEVLEQLRALKNKNDWDLLTRETRAKALRLEASLLLALDQDVSLVKTFAKNAFDLDGVTSQALDALITYHEKGAVAALAELHTPASLDAWNVKLALQLDSGNWRAVVDGYMAPPDGVTPDAESRRLFALGLLGSGRLTDARNQVQIALAEHPQWFSIRFTAAILDYFDSVSPALLRHIPKHWPVPTDMRLVKRDKEALQKLRRAESTLTDLIEAGGLTHPVRRELEGWRLACLANDAERQSEAQNCCAELLEQDPRHQVAILWASARDYISDLDKNVAAVAADLGASL